MFIDGVGEQFAFETDLDDARQALVRHFRVQAGGAPRLTVCEALALSAVLIVQSAGPLRRFFYRAPRWVSLVYPQPNLRSLLCISRELSTKLCYNPTASCWQVRPFTVTATGMLARRLPSRTG